MQLHKQNTGALSFPAAALILILVAVVALGYLVFRSTESFPVLAKGGYVGKVSGVVAGQETPMYLEYDSDSLRLTVVLFEPGFKAQALDLIPIGDDAGGVKAFRPVVFRHAGISWALTGKTTRIEVTGSIAGSNGVKGGWSVRPSRRQAHPASEVDLYSWLAVKARKRKAEAELSRLSDAYQEEEQLNETLNDLLSQETVLAGKGLAVRDQLSDQVESKQAIKESLKSEVSRLSSELSLLGRITERGKIVDLARRVASRENRWYAANWAVQEDSANLEELLGSDVDVDIGRLTSAAQKAQEIRSLKQEIAREKTRIQELERALIERIRGPSRFEKEKEEDPRQPRTIWNRVFG